MAVAHIGSGFVSGSARLSAAAKAKRQELSSLWKDLNFSQAMADPGYGYFVLDRGQYGVGSFTSTQATAGTATYPLIAQQAGFGSILELDSNSTTNTQGIQVQFTGQGVTPVDGMTVYFETMLRAKDIATGPEFFAGLATIDTSLISSGAISAADWIGFYEPTGDNALHIGIEDGTQDISTNPVHTLVDGATTTDGTEWVKLGFRWVVGQTLEVYVNDALVSHDLAISAEPDGHIVVSFVCQTNGTTDPIVERAWHAFGYKYPA